jgi:hypothetical protein
MLATAAKLSRALAATFDVLLSELALEVQLEALLQVTQYPLPASAGIWAGGFWQIVSIKKPNNFKGHRSLRLAFFYFPSAVPRLGKLVGNRLALCGFCESRFAPAAMASNQCRSKGIAVSVSDMLICAVAQSRGWPIFSLDPDFQLYSKFIPLKLHPVRK